MDAFSKRLLDIVSDGMLSLGLGLAYELKLFDALAEISSKEKPATAADLAAKTDMKERYLKEWMCLMSCGDIIEVSEDGEHFWIREERVPLLSGPTPSVMLVFQPHTEMFGRAYPTVLEVFKKDGPPGADFHHEDDFHKHIEAFSEASTKKHLISDVLPLVGVAEKLEKGEAWVLDVGCGRGMHMAEIASHFPNSLFVGIDFSLDAVVGASRRIEQANEGLQNLSYFQMDAQKLKKEWNEKFDWVTIFNACHDQTRPDISLKEIHRVLKKDGVFSMLEVDGTGNVYKDKQDNEMATLFYGSSLFGCLPVGSNAPDALALGTMWGREKAQNLLKEAGFEKIEVHPLSFMKGNVLYVCRK